MIKKKKFRKFSIDVKLKYVKLANRMGFNFISDLAGINRKMLKEWEKKSELFKNIPNKQKVYRLPGGGAKSQTLNNEDKLIKVINELKKNDIKITCKVVINEIIKIQPEMGLKNKKTLRKWCYRFFKRNKIK